MLLALQAQRCHGLLTPCHRGVLPFALLVHSLPHYELASDTAAIACSTCRYGPAVPSSEREGSRNLILAIAGLWLLCILIGGLLHRGQPSPALWCSRKMFDRVHARMP